eukprot:m51a1_g9822 putative high affinity camp-specific and ibmx-insensitive 3 -cyclic phosphodiesterase 8a (609) ;mRNA; f:1905769-1908168
MLALRAAAAVIAILCSLGAGQALQYVFVEPSASDGTDATQQAGALRRLVDISQGKAIDQMVLGQVRIPELLLNAESLALLEDLTKTPRMTHNVIMTSKSGGITTFNQLMDLAQLRKTTDPLVVGGLGKAHQEFLESLTPFDARAARLQYVDLVTVENCVSWLASGKITAIVAGSSTALQYSNVAVPVAISAQEIVPELPNVPTLRDMGVGVVAGSYYGIVVPKWVEEGHKVVLSSTLDSIAKNVSFIEAVRRLGFHPLFYKYPASAALVERMAAMLNSSSSEEPQAARTEHDAALVTVSLLFALVFLVGALVADILLYLRHKREKMLIGRHLDTQKGSGAQKYSTLDTPITEAMKAIHSIREHVNPAHAKALKRKLMSTSLTQLDGRSVTSNPEVLDVITELGVVKEPYLKARGIVPRFSVSSRRAKEATPWIVDNYEVCMMVSRQLEEWDYSPIEFREKVEGHTLSAALLYSFKKFDLIGYLGINDITLCTWTKVVEDAYSDVAFHNKHHAADVVQAVMYLIERSPLARSRELVFITLVAAAFHDIGHPGRTTSYLVSKGEQLSQRYNDTSVLQNHALVTGFERTLQSDDCNVFRAMARASGGTAVI